MNTIVKLTKKRYDELMKAAGETVLTPEQASKAIAIKVAAIKAELKEIKSLVERSGVQLKFGGYSGLFSKDLEGIDSLHNDWQSSSYDC